MAGDLATDPRAATLRPLGRMPVAIPDNAADKTVPKARGLVRLPGHIAWSPPYVYGLDDRPQRCRAYARVMSEGLAADILDYIDIDALVDMWDEIHLAAHVR